MTDVYEQFEKHTARVSGDVILYKGDSVGRVVFVHPRDGAGRLYCYLQFWGSHMERGSASGYGYNKRKAAFEDAMGRLAKQLATCPDVPSPMKSHAMIACETYAADKTGEDWDVKLRTGGFTTAHVV